MYATIPRRNNGSNHKEGFHPSGMEMHQSQGIYRVLAIWINEEGNEFLRSGFQWEMGGKAKCTLTNEVWDGLLCNLDDCLCCSAHGVQMMMMRVRAQARRCAGV
jgi:hypothetical protein